MEILFIHVIYTCDIPVLSPIESVAPESTAIRQPWAYSIPDERIDTCFPTIRLPLSAMLRPTSFPILPPHKNYISYLFIFSSYLVRLSYPIDYSHRDNTLLVY